MLEVSDKNPSEFWKIVSSFKDRSQDPSCNIAPQDWYNYCKDLMNIEYNNNFVELDECKYLHCNNDLKLFTHDNENGKTKYISKITFILK